MLLSLAVPRTGDHISILVLKHLPKPDGVSQNDGARVSQQCRNRQSLGFWGVFFAETGFFI